MVCTSHQSQSPLFKDIEPVLSPGHWREDQVALHTTNKNRQGRRLLLGSCRQTAVVAGGVRSRTRPILGCLRKGRLATELNPDSEAPTRCGSSEGRTLDRPLCENRKPRPCCAWDGRLFMEFLQEVFYPSCRQRSRGPEKARATLRLGRRRYYTIVPHSCFTKSWTAVGRHRMQHGTS